MAKTGLENPPSILKIPGFARFSASHGHNFALRDLFSPFIEKWETLDSKFGTKHGFSCVRIQAKQIFFRDI